MGAADICCCRALITQTVDVQKARLVQPGIAEPSKTGHGSCSIPTTQAPASPFGAKHHSTMEPSPLCLGQHELAHDSLSIAQSVIQGQREGFGMSPSRLSAFCLTPVAGVIEAKAHDLACELSLIMDRAEAALAVGPRSIDESIFLSSEVSQTLSFVPMCLWLAIRRTKHDEEFSHIQPRVELCN
jgi:hypothetical protein